MDDELLRAGRSGTGWPTVDAEIRDLRQRFAVARADQDHCAVGAACVRVLEHVGEAAFNPAIHLPVGTPVPRRDRIKDRLEAVIPHTLPGPENERLRKLERSTIAVAQEVKHRRTSTRRDAGITADSVVMLANLLRRLRDGAPKRTSTWKSDGVVSSAVCGGTQPT